MEKRNRLALFALDINPENSNEYVVGGEGPFVQVYDRRFTTEDGACVRKFSPEYLANRRYQHVKSVVYSYNGQEILASYASEKMYLFSSQETVSSKYLQCYSDRIYNCLNEDVIFFGLRSEFVISPSRSGRIIIWEKKSGTIVNYLKGDESSVYHIDPHPNLPILAASGFRDCDIKIWSPSSENEPDLSELGEKMMEDFRIQEAKRRELEMPRYYRAAARAYDDDDDDDDEEEDDDDDDEEEDDDDEDDDEDEDEDDDIDVMCTQS